MLGTFPMFEGLQVLSGASFIQYSQSPLCLSEMGGPSEQGGSRILSQCRQHGDPNSVEKFSGKRLNCKDRNDFTSLNDFLSLSESRQQNSDAKGLTI